MTVGQERQTTRDQSTSGEWVPLCAVILALGILRFASITPGHSWGDDFAQYILHARNIAYGIGYDATGYIYSPLRPEVGPPQYPPLLPMLLAPVYALTNGSLWWMKAAGVAFFLLFVGAMHLCFRLSLGRMETVLLALLVSLHQVVAGLADAVCSDLVFCLFTYLCLHFIDQTALNPTNGRFKVGLLSMLLLAYASRTIGAVLLPTAVLTIVAAERKVSRNAVIVGACGLLLLLAQNLVLDSTTRYFDQLNISYSSLAANVKSYSYHLSTLWDLNESSLVKNIIFLVASMLALVGFVHRILRGPLAYEFFAVLYSIPILLWPSPQGFRFLLPIAPLYVFYAFMGYKIVVPRLHVAPSLTGALACSLLLGVCIHNVLLAVPAVSEENVIDQDAQALFSFIGTLEKSARLFSPKPRATALFSGRSSAAYPLRDDPSELDRHAQSLGIRYLVIGKLENPDFQRSRDYAERFIVGSGARTARLIYDHGRFQLYQLRSEPVPGVLADAERQGGTTGQKG